MQGWRVQMEDAHFIHPALEGPGWEDTAAFCVMDGHGGKEVAEFCAHYLPAQIVARSSRDVANSLVSAFHEMDEMLRDGERGMNGEPGFNNFKGRATRANPHWVGCTAVVCLIRSDVIIVANAGDSRAVLSRRRQAVPLSEDHKPNNPREKDRIHKAGGHVERQQIGADNVQYRVNGNLNLSRSIGDLEYKKNPNLLPGEQMICSTPEVHNFKREPGDEFVLLACDGVWDVLTNQDAIDFVHARLPAVLRNRRPLSWILEEMLDSCLSPDLMKTRGLGGDNMTAVLIVFDGLEHTLGDPSPASSGGHQVTGSTHSTNLDEAAIVPEGLCWCHTKALK